MDAIGKRPPTVRGIDKPEATYKMHCYHEQVLQKHDRLDCGLKLVHNSILRILTFVYGNLASLCHVINLSRRVNALYSGFVHS